MTDIIIIFRIKTQLLIMLKIVNVKEIVRSNYHQQQLTYTCTIINKILSCLIFRTNSSKRRMWINMQNFSPIIGYLGFALSFRSKSLQKWSWHIYSLRCHFILDLPMNMDKKLYIGEATCALVFYHIREEWHSWWMASKIG